MSVPAVRRLRCTALFAAQVVGSWLLTGEDASYKGVARPNHPFTVGAAGWGAFELVARYGRAQVSF